nr:pentatricopeptide repeat protein AaPPR113 [Agave angustifolia]
MEEKAVTVDARCCRSIVQAFSKGGYLKEAFNWLTFVGDNDFTHALLPLYNIFLSECGSRQSFLDADRCMKLMEGQFVGKSEITYWELLKLAVIRRNLSAVNDIWKDCTKYYSPSIVTLRKFIWSFTRLDALESAYAVLRHMVALATREGSSLRTSSAGRYQSSRLDIPIPSYGELPHRMSGSKGTTCSPNILLEAKMETEGGLKRSFMDQVNKEKQSFCDADKVLILGRFNLDPSHVPISVGNRISNELDKDKINSQLPPSAATASGSDNQYLEQEEFTELNLQNIIQQEMGIGELKARASPPVMNILRWSFNNVIHASARARNFKLAEHLFMQMHDLGLEPSGDTYDGFVKAVVYGKGVAYGMKVIESMEKRNIKPYNDTLAVLSTDHSKNLKLDLAEDLLEKISDGLPKYIHPFNAILAACDVMDQPERAVRILSKMKHLNIKSNIRTYELLFSLFGNVNIPYEKGNMLSHAEVSKRINAIEKDMIRSGVQHSYTSMKNLIRALGAEGMIHEMLRCLNRAESLLWDIDSYQKSDMYNIVLHALIKAKESSTAIELFKNMRLSGFSADVATYNMMIECCSKLPCFKSASALLSMMLRDGFIPQTLTYTALIKVLLASDDFDKAVHLLDQASSDSIQLDIQLFNTILKQAYRKGRIDIIELIVELIHRYKIQPDPSTCWCTFSAYVELGFQSTAMEALQVLSLRMISEEDSILQEHKDAYEDLLYSEEPDAESKIVNIFKESQEFIATALLSLRWCAINGVLLSWSPKESVWAKRLSSSYAAARRNAI